MRKEIGRIDVHFILECTVRAGDMRERNAVFAWSVGGGSFADEDFIGRDGFEGLEVVEAD